MTLETFFKKFDQFADAPGAVGKMRELVFRLAIQGKLVKQDCSEESATVLLKRIRAKKAELPANRQSGDNADSMEIDEDLSLFSAPSGWTWTSLGNVQVFTNGYAFKSEDYQPAGIGIIRMGELGANGEIDERNMKYVSNDVADSIPETFRVRPGDLLMGMSGSIGKLAINRSNNIYLLNQRVGRLEPILIEKAFLHVFLKTIEQHYLRISFGMAIKNLSTKQINETPFPLPPLAEQKRIVAKVDELMALCDRLEEQQREREMRQAALARASLARFADAPTPANLSFLFHPSYTIAPADLRKSILTLAVQGKLVPQDPSDEPAKELIKRVARELTSEQRRGQAPPLLPQQAESPQLELPSGWTWAHFCDVAIIASNLVKPVDFLDFMHLAPDNIEKGNGLLLPCATVREDKVISSNHRFYPGQIIYSKIRPNLAKVVVVDFDGLCSADMYPIDALIDPFYLQRYMLSESFLAQAVKTDTRVAMPKINQMELNAIAVPVPPLVEQRRIVAKVGQLMALVDQLENQLAAAKTASAAVLEAAIHELLNPTAQIIMFPSAHRDPPPDRAAIGCYAIQRLGNKRTFGRTAQVKVLYLAETHLGLDLGGQYLRDAAGPFDHWIYKFEDEAKRQQWFSVKESSTQKGNKIEYRTGPSLAAKAAEASTHFPAAARSELDRLLALLADRPTVEVEIITTLFAAWNDFLIDGRSPTDAEIAHDVRENWHPSKKRFSEVELEAWLAWLRRHSLVPKGRGPHTVGQQAELRLQ